MKYRLTEFEIVDAITDPKDTWGIGEIRNPKRLIVLPSDK